MSYHHLTTAEREEVRVLSGQGHSYRSIARQLKRNPSTISREFKRNQADKKTYKAHEAQTRYEIVRKKCKPAKKVLRPEISSVIIERLELYWSPEQIIGRLKLPISLSTIYRALRAGILPTILVEKLRRGGTDTKGRRKNGVNYPAAPPLMNAQPQQ